MLSIVTSHPEMQEDGIWLHAQIVPNVNPIITSISDVSPDQEVGCPEFTRSYFDGWYGNQRTELYTVELNDNEPGQLQTAMSHIKTIDMLL